MWNRRNFVRQCHNLLSQTNETRSRKGWSALGRRLRQNKCVWLFLQSASEWYVSAGEEAGFVRGWQAGAVFWYHSPVLCHFDVFHLMRAGPETFLIRAFSALNQQLNRATWSHQNQSARLTLAPPPIAPRNKFRTDRRVRQAGNGAPLLFLFSGVLLHFISSLTHHH